MEGEVLPEGAEQAPPGVRTMAVARWALVAVLAAVAIGAWGYHWARQSSGATVADASFQCPMHPAVMTTDAGQCPVCGMDLVPIAPGAKAPPAPASQPPPHGHPAEGAYWCPMHPEVTSDDPEARCEKCGGMKLMPRVPPETKPAGDAQGRGVPGLVPVVIPQERTQLLGMRTAKVVRETLSPELRAVGFVTPDEFRLAIVNARFAGWIEELSVTQYSPHVRKGDVLATVYSPELLSLQQAFVNSVRWSQVGVPSSATANIRDLNVQDDPRLKLHLLGIADEDLEEIARSLQPARAMRIRAPTSGWVVKSAAVKGLYVEPGVELFQIADLSTVWVIAEVYEYEMRRVRRGQKARLELTAHPDETFAGRVQYLYPTVNPATRTMQVRLEFRNPGMKLRPGMFGDVLIRLGETPALTVPAEAVVDTGEVQYVLVAKEGGRFEPRRIRAGTRAGPKVEVLSGLSEGETVVTTANFLIDSESRLRAAIQGFSGAPGEHR